MIRYVDISLHVYISISCIPSDRWKPNIICLADNFTSTKLYTHLKRVMRHVHRKKNSGLECVIHHSTVVREGEGRKGGTMWEERGPFYHRTARCCFAWNSKRRHFDTFPMRGKTKYAGLCCRPYVKQEIGSGGISRIGCQFILELSQWDHVHCFVVTLQPGDALLVALDTATVHAATPDSIHQLLLILARAGFAPEVFKYTWCFVRGRGGRWRRWIRTRNATMARVLPLIITIAVKVLRIRGFIR